MGYEAAATVINDAAVELGLWTADVADPFGSTDPNAVRLLRLLKRMGRRLVKAHAWSNLLKTHTLATVSGTGDYALPADYARALDTTHWNRTATTPLDGPSTAHEWAYFKGGTTVGTFRKAFRVVGGRFHVHPVPTAVETLAFDYVSSYWVRPSGEAAATADAPTHRDDELQLDADLLVAALQWAFKKKTGLDTSEAWEEFQTAYGAAVAADSPGRVLSLTGRYGPHALDWHNVPEGDWGV